MYKLKEIKGFTRAELLIVVAIIAVLVAVAIPVFTAQLNKSKLATATANARSAYAEYVADCLTEAETPTVSGLNAEFTSDKLAVSGASAVASGGTVTVTISGVSGNQTFTIDSDIK